MKTIVQDDERLPTTWKGRLLTEIPKEELIRIIEHLHQLNLDQLKQKQHERDILTGHRGKGT